MSALVSFAAGVAVGIPLGVIIAVIALIVLLYLVDLFGNAWAADEETIP